MKKYKVCVYAIAKNEEKFVNRWVESMCEADEIYVLDTNSTDNTVAYLRNNGVNVVTQEVIPWRFDDARNMSLSLVPDDVDICVCTDLDEIFTKGWRQELEKAWTQETSQLAYNYIWNFDNFGNPGITFYIHKIHGRHNFKWVNPVHEVLQKIESDNKVLTYCESITLNHYPDHTKSRSSYLPLLELAVEEDPNNDRNKHYLGREYMYYQKWDECIRTLHQHLQMPTAIWKDERAASMRFIARSYVALNYLEEAEMWFKKSINEAPHLREGLTEIGFFYYDQDDYKNTIKYLNKALNIKEKPKTYICEAFCYNERIYDILSLAYYYEKNYEEAINSCKIAISINPNDQRIKNNLKEYEKLIK